MAVRISWQSPADNFKTITKYRILIQDTNANGNYAENTQYCDGTDPTVISLLRCDVPVLTVLRQPPFSLV